MKKTAAIYMASLMMMTPVSWAWAQQNPGENEGRTAESAETQAALADLQNPSTATGKAAAALEKQLAENWEGTTQILGQELKTKTGNALQREIDRYKLKYTIGLKDQHILSSILTADANYQIVVEPNFRDGEQIRRDVYVFGLGARKGQGSGGHLGGKVQVRVTFSRVFKGPNAKWEALKPLPYFLNKLPGTADGIKEKMKVGETVRLEILGNVGLGLSSDKKMSKGSSSASVGMAREALFVADIYRHSAEQVRIRLFGLKNRGTFNVSTGVTLSPWSSQGSGGGKLGDAIRDASNIGARIGFSKSADLFNDFPIDTMMLDYLYTFKSAQPVSEGSDSAEAAVTELLANIQRFGYVPLFNLFSSDRDLAQILKERAKLSETLAKEDYGNPRARVRHLFKGRITSNVTTSTVGMSLSKIIGKTKATITDMKSFVRTEDTMDRISYYLLNSASNSNESESFYGRSEKVTTNDVDVLMKSNENKQVTGLLDIVTTSEIRDKKLTVGEIRTAKDLLLQTLPDSLKTSELERFFPTSDQRKAHYRSKYSFGLQALVAMNRLDEPRITQALFEFFEKHPDRAMMHLPDLAPSSGGIAYSDYVTSLGALIYRAVGSNFSNEERSQALQLLMRDQIFQRYLAGEFLTSLLPESEMQKLTNINLMFSSDETPSKELSMGEYKASDVYRFVAFLRSVLNDRSYDLRLETQINESGDEVLVTPQIKGFNIKGTPAE